MNIFLIFRGVELRYFSNLKRVDGLCNLYLQQFLFLYFQTLHNDYSHMEDVHLSFCAHLIIFFWRVLTLDISSIRNT